MTNDKEKFKKEFFARLITFAVAVLRLTDTLKENRTLWAACDQVIRSAGSVGANVVEAKAASSKRDYLKFFEIALKSANETQYWLLVLQQYDKAKYEPLLKPLIQEAGEIARILTSSVLTMKGRK